jgi:hypothetical protein
MCYVFAYYTVLTDYHWDCLLFFRHTLLPYKAQTMTQPLSIVTHY